MTTEALDPAGSTAREGTRETWGLESDTGRLLPRSALDVLVDLSDKVSSGRVSEYQPVPLGFTPPDDHAHAPNEYMDLRNYETGIRTIVRFFDELRDLPRE